MGNLPVSRTKTYVDGDAVDPNILNELQDRDIIRAGTKILQLGASAFSSFNTLPVSEFEWSFAAPPNDVVVAPLLLPVGSIIHSILFYFNHNGAGGTMSFDFRKSVSGGTPSSVAGQATDTSGGSSYITKSLNVGNYQMVVGTSVYVKVSAGAVGNKFGFAEVTYDTTLV